MTRSTDPRGLTLATGADTDYLRTVLDAIPALVFIIDDQMIVRDTNRAAANFIGQDPPCRPQALCGDVLRCVNAVKPDGCGTTSFCRECVVRRSTTEAVQKRTTVRDKAHMELRGTGDAVRDVWYDVTAAPFEYAGQPLALIILEDITELMLLRSLVPICSGCKKIRTADDQWEEVERYLERDSDLRFSHGVCPDCMARLYPEYMAQRTGKTD